jgi:hypothetical protein
MWVAAAVLVGVGWRTTRYFLQFPIWGDESFVCVNLLDQTFGGLIGGLKHGQICPLFFLWAELAACHLLGFSELAVRLVPFGAGLAALALFWPLARLLLPRRQALLAVAILAVSYYPVRHSCEVKPYAFDLLWAVILLLPAAAWIQRPRRGLLVVLTALVPLVLVSSFPAVFVAGAISVTLLPVIWRGGRGDKIWFVLFNLAMMLAFVGHYLLIGQTQYTAETGGLGKFLDDYWQDWLPPADAVGLGRWLVLAHTGNMMAYPVGGPHGGSVVTLLLCIMGGWSLWQSGRRQVLALLTVPFVLSMLAAVLHKYPYGGSARLAQHLAPSICLLLAQGVVYLVSCLPLTAAGRLRLAGAAALVFAVVAGVGLARDVRKPFKTPTDAWNRNFADQLLSQAGPNDQVVVFHEFGQIHTGLEWYLRRQDPRIAWHGAVDWPQLEASGGRLWCVRATQPPFDDESLRGFGRAGEHPVMVIRRERSLQPPEHPEDPDVYFEVCVVQKVK